MKKLLLGFFILMLPLAVCASPIDITIIDGITFNGTTTDTMSSVVSIADLTNPTFYVLYDEDAGDSSGTAVTITAEVSNDGSNWMTASWFDFSGGPASFQTSESISVDTNYVGWLEKAANYPFFRLSAASSGSAATSTAVINSFMRGVK